MRFRELIKTISKKEWMIIAVSWLVLLLISFAPFLFALPWIEQGYVISGMHNWYHVDVNVYLSYLKQVIDGSYLVDTIFTTEDALPMFRPFWLILGLLGRFLHLSPLVTFHLGRIIFSAILLPVLYIFLQQFFTKKSESIFIFLVSVFSMGVGIFLAPWVDKIKYLPIDVWMPESFIFLSSLHSPHLLYSWTLLILVYLLWLLLIGNFNKPKSRLFYSLLMGFMAMFLFVTHPFHILPVYLIIGCHFLFLIWRERCRAKEIFTSLLIFITLSFIGVFYHLYYISFDWLTIAKSIQISAYSPNIITVGLGFGVIFFIGFYQLAKIIVKQKNNITISQAFIIVWAILQLLLAYFPVSWQRRMLQGLQIPLVVLAGWWLTVIWKKLKYRHQFDFNIKLLAIYMFAGLLFFSSSIGIVMIDSLYYKSADRYKKNFYYYSSDFYSAAKFLGKKSDKNSKIFCNIKTGNYLAGLIGRRVFIGHGIETAFSNAKKEMIYAFFGDKINDEKKYNLLKQHNIDYIFYSVEEKKIGDPKLLEKDYLNLTYKNNEVEIYEVIYK